MMMKHPILLVCLIIVASLVGCQGKEIIAVAPNGSGLTATAALTVTPTSNYSVTPTETPIILSEAQLNFQCLDVVPTPPDGAASTGIVVLAENMTSSVNGTLLLDMETGQMIQIARPDEVQINFVVSPDRTLMAFNNVISDAENRKIRDELIIVTADGQRQKMIPWEKKWLSILGWVSDQSLLFAYDEPAFQADWQKTPISYLVLNPFSGERQILRPDFPRFLDAPSTILPYWNGWLGTVYNSSLTLAVYPRLLEDDNNLYTYALWDVSEHQLIVSLDDIFVAYSLFNDTYPIPLWSPSGLQFVFQGVVETADLPKFELYKVEQNGKVEQLTRLTSVALVQDSNFSWSPDERYLAMYLTTWGDNIWETRARVAVLALATLEVTDYCIRVSGKGNIDGLPLMPIWSPDSKQFLVTDWDDENNQRVILVDIEKGSAFQIAEGIEPVGWMVAP
jgi:hypothetical protein